MAGIVVGVDGSPSSFAAAGWAIREARLRRVPVTAVYVAGPSSDLPGAAAARRPYGLSPVDVSGPEGPDPQALAEQADQRRRQAQAVVEEWVDQISEPTSDVDLRCEVRFDQVPAEALMAAAAEADLLVVGSRGRGGFSGLLLGSVSQQVLQHAPCPVVVLRPE